MTTNPVPHEISLLEPSWTQAHDAAFSVGRQVCPETIPLAGSVGRVLAETVHSLIDLPLNATSAMDGWVVSSPEGPWRLESSALAGHPMSHPLARGTAAVIATGGVIPEGAYGVVRREYGQTHSEHGVTWVETNTDNRGEPAKDGHVRPAGAESLKGEILITPGRVLTPAHVGLAAVAGHDTLVVRRKVTAEILIMGDEILESGLPATGQVRDAFSIQMPAYAGMLGLDAISSRFVPDTLEAAVEAIGASRADVVITTGGTAAGPADFLHPALEQVGAHLVIDQIAMRPGHPNLLASLGGNRFLVGLPGNPLSAVLGGMLTLVRPLARALNGLGPVELGTVRTGVELHAPAADSRLVPYHLESTDNGTHAVPTRWLNSGMLRGIAGADGVMIAPPGGAPAGAMLPDLPLAW